MRLDGAIGGKLAQPAVADGGVAIATVLIAPGGRGASRRVRALDEHFRGEVGVSAWNGIRRRAAVRRGWRRAAARSRRGAHGRARRDAAAALAELT